MKKGIVLFIAAMAFLFASTVMADQAQATTAKKKAHPAPTAQGQAMPHHAAPRVQTRTRHFTPPPQAHIRADRGGDDHRGNHGDNGRDGHNDNGVPPVPPSRDHGGDHRGGRDDHRGYDDDGGRYDHHYHHDRHGEWGYGRWDGDWDEYHHYHPWYPFPFLYVTFGDVPRTVWVEYGQHAEWSGMITVSPTAGAPSVWTMVKVTTVRRSDGYDYKDADYTTVRLRSLGYNEDLGGYVYEVPAEWNYEFSSRVGVLAVAPQLDGQVLHVTPRQDDAGKTIIVVPGK